MKKYRLAFFIERLKIHFTESSAWNTAIVIAYYMLLSIVPLVIMLVNLLPLFQINPQAILVFSKAAFPDYVYKQMVPIVTSILTTSNGGLLSFGAIGTLWASSKGINAVRQSINKIYDVQGGRNAFIRRIISFIMTVVFILVLLSLSLAFGFGQLVLEWLSPIVNLPDQVTHWFGTLKWPVAISALVILLTLFYYALPSVRLRIRAAFPGALLTTTGWLALSQGFALYVRYFTGTVRSYGNVGTFIVLLFWLQFSAFILIVGAIVNLSLDETIHGSITNKQERSYKLSRNNKLWRNRWKK